MTVQWQREIDGPSPGNEKDMVANETRDREKLPRQQRRLLFF
jgi:hypothetical protein